MEALDDLIATYLSAWNDQDATSRLASLTECWTPTGVLIDPFDEEPAVGPTQISESIGRALRERVPPNHRFVLTSGLDRHRSIFRYGWALVDDRGTALRQGTDTGRLAPDGRLDLILTFLGPLPPLP